MLAGLIAGVFGVAATRAAPAAGTQLAMADLRIAATIPIGETADWVAITEAGVWVGSTGPNAISMIDPTSNAVTRVELPGRPCAGVVADVQAVWVPLCGPVPKLAKVDAAHHVLDRVFDVGPTAPEGGIAIGGGSVWLVTDKLGTLARINPETGTVTQVVHLPPGSYNPVFAAGRIWVSRVEGAAVTAVDAASGAIVGETTVGPHPRFLTGGDGAVWTLNQGDGTLSRVDIAGHRPVVTLALGTPGPGGDAKFADGLVWTTMMQTPLTAVDAKTARIRCQWAGAGGDSLDIGHGAIWLTNLRQGTVSRIELTDLPPHCRRSIGR